MPALGSLLLALALGLLLSDSVLVPLRKTQRRLAAIAAGDFSGHVEVPNRDEIGALAADVNRMSDELQRVYRELELASERKSEYVTNMSHELRTPLNAIIGFSEVLHEQMFGELNDRQLDYVNEVLEAGKHLLSLINDLLDLAKIEGGRMEVELSQVAVPARPPERHRAAHGAGHPRRDRAVPEDASRKRSRSPPTSVVSARSSSTSSRTRSSSRPPGDGSTSPPVRTTVTSRSPSQTRGRGSPRATSRRSSKSSSRAPTARTSRERASGCRSPASSSSSTVAGSGSRARSAVAAPSASPSPSARASPPQPCRNRGNSDLSDCAVTRPARDHHAPETSRVMRRLGGG